MVGGFVLVFLVPAFANSLVVFMAAVQKHFPFSLPLDFCPISNTQLLLKLISFMLESKRNCHSPAEILCSSGKVHMVMHQLREVSPLFS